MRKPLIQIWILKSVLRFWISSLFINFKAAHTSQLSQPYSSKNLPNKCPYLDFVAAASGHNPVLRWLLLQPQNLCVATERTDRRGEFRLVFKVFWASLQWGHSGFLLFHPEGCCCSASNSAAFPSLQAKENTLHTSNRPVGKSFYSTSSFVILPLNAAVYMYSKKRA